MESNGLSDGISEVLLSFHQPEQEEHPLTDDQEPSSQLLYQCQLWLQSQPAQHTRVNPF